MKKIKADKKKNKSEIKTLIFNIEKLFSSVKLIETYEKNIFFKMLAKDERFKDLEMTLSECAVLVCISNNSKINATEIAQEISVTKGAISKITVKLVNKDLILTKRLATNLKEISYELTPLGRAFVDFYDSVKKATNNLLKKEFSSYGKKQTDFSIKFIDDLLIFLEK